MRELVTQRDLQKSHARLQYYECCIKIASADEIESLFVAVSDKQIILLECGFGRRIFGL